MFSFENKVVIVTGAAGALGRVVAHRFSNTGAAVVLVDVDKSLLDAEVEKLGNPSSIGIVTDLTDAISVNNMVNEVHSRMKTVDILANIAGGFRMGPRVHETKIEEWEYMFHLNATSAFLTSRAVIPLMIGGHGGKIVNIAARVANEGKGKMAPYSVAKSAVARLTESLAAEYRGDNINVNCIMPGTIDTPANRRDMPDADFSRWVSPAALADVILFLCSNEARAIHGASIPVFGLT